MSCSPNSSFPRVYIFIFSWILLIPCEIISGKTLKQGSANDSSKEPTIPSECNSTLQSPINIDTKAVEKKTLPPLNFQNFNVEPYSSEILAGNDSFHVKLYVDQPVEISGGPLKAPYRFDQFHFHWGADNEGSEHTLNNKKFASELHIVFYKTSYDNFKAALQHKDGVAVIAIWLELSELDNQVYSEILWKLPMLSETEKSTFLSSDRPLHDFMPPSLKTYFTYAGSLTTFPCSEVVTWIIFEKPDIISHSQLVQLRKFKPSSGYVLLNARNIQATNERKVYFVSQDLPSPSPNIIRIKKEEIQPLEEQKGEHSGFRVCHKKKHRCSNADPDLQEQRKAHKHHGCHRICNSDLQEQRPSCKKHHCRRHLDSDLHEPRPSQKCHQRCKRHHHHHHRCHHNKDPQKERNEEEKPSNEPGQSENK